MLIFQTVSKLRAKVGSPPALDESLHTLCVVNELFFISIFMLVPIIAKSPYAYGHHHTGMGPQYFYGDFPRQQYEYRLNIGPHTGMVICKTPYANKDHTRTYDF